MKELIGFSEHQNPNDTSGFTIATHEFFCNSAEELPAPSSSQV
jgi:hypothetical protein